MGYRERNNNYPMPCPDEQKHVHELQGSTKVADANDPHSHRFCTVTGEAIPYGGNDHVHDVAFRTDFFEDHYHEFRGRTGCCIKVDEDRHVHYIESVTSVDDGHRHAFEAATLIEDPTHEHRRKDYCHHDEHHHDEHHHDEHHHDDHHHH